LDVPYEGCTEEGLLLKSIPDGAHIKQTKRNVFILCEADVIAAPAQVVKIFD